MRFTNVAASPTHADIFLLSHGPVAVSCSISAAECHLLDTNSNMLDHENQQEELQNDVTSIAIDHNGKFLALANSKKQLHLFSALDRSTQRTCILPKRSTALTFAQRPNIDGQDILVADKSGDVTAFPSTHDSIVDETQRDPSGVEVLGLLSMILDLVYDDRHNVVITADRDEKIRVSYYPNAYNIQSYCLGHRSMVTSLALSNAYPDLLISGSADGTVRVWKHMNETQQHVESMPGAPALDAEIDPDTVPIVSKVDISQQGIVAVLLERSASIYLYMLDQNGTLKSVGVITRPKDVASIQFLADGRLLVVSDIPGDKMIVLYSIRPANDSMEFVEDSIEATRAISEQFASHISGVVNETSYPLRALIKRSTAEGVTTYLERKEQRLNEMNNKIDKRRRLSDQRGTDNNPSQETANVS